MCGIAGIVYRDGADGPGGPGSNVRGDLDAIAAALDGALAHRGPDGAGTWRSAGGDALLVHRRLAIIDVGADGAQPMVVDPGDPGDNAQRVIVFNGEIYNYRELRRELEAAGHCFRTASDTEVLLRLVASAGPGALARVRGMFAFAMMNPEARSILLARDRFGIKPLYVAAAPARLAFASELGALRRAALADGRPSPAAVLAFLSWGSVPAPLAWNRGLEAVEPGTWIEWWQDGRERRGRFADARAPYVTATAPVRPAREMRPAVAQAVRDSVRAHLVSDVPVGVFLSGGIDSGAIVSCAISAGASGLQTFTVAFDDVTSESERARTVAERFGTTHHELHLDGSRVVADLPAVVSRLDQPTVDAVNSFYVSQAVAATGVKAVLSGAGGDELFGGYPSFVRLPRAMAAKRFGRPVWPAIAAAGRGVLPLRLQSRWRHFAASNGSIAEAYRVQRGFLLPDEVRAIAGPALMELDGSSELERAERLLLDPIGPERPPASVARLETRLYLQSQLLRDLDVMSMAHGLEVRVPFVDHELVAAVWPELGRHGVAGFSGLAGKSLLHAGLELPLPAAVVRHPKQGFTLPFARWMRGDLEPFVRDGLNLLARDGWINREGPSRVWREWLEGRVHWTRPWGLGVLGHFLDVG
ncbi:MAG TPA: asparagine synthase (glutamine-hydrolyzing) [Vicinamibacterales bacterium]|jgi:asparagine synthase (glutamine-hydrolysing)|nr:asparagine synthase (glutamine-hydrolyzing) [Vicinamibacterales bacterium]